jgi:hypothetical protein
MTSYSLTAVIVTGVATVLGLVYVMPTVSAALNGWTRLRREYGIPRAAQPAGRSAHTWVAVWLGQRWPRLDAQAEGDLWPLTVTISDTGLYLRVQHAFGRLAQPVLIPWDAMEEAQAPQGYTLGLLLPKAHIHLGLRGSVADEVTGYRRWVERQASRSGPAA